MVFIIITWHKKCNLYDTFLQTKNERTKTESAKESNEDIFADFGNNIEIDLNDNDLLD